MAGGKYTYRIRSNPDIPVKALRQDIMKEHIVEVLRVTLYRVRNDAIRELLGSEEKQYKLLSSYYPELMKSNRGTKCVIKARPVGEGAAMFLRGFTSVLDL